MIVVALVLGIVVVDRVMLLDKFSEQGEYTCELLKNQTDISNACIELLTNITGYPLTKSVYVNCSS